MQNNNNFFLNKTLEYTKNVEASWKSWILARKIRFVCLKIDFFFKNFVLTHRRKPEPFDWYLRIKDIETHLISYIKPNYNYLDVGCGTSRK